MANSRISKRIVDGLETTGREYVVWDSDLPGFGVRVRGSGAKSYIVQYRAGSGRSAPDRKITLGAVGKLAPDEARTLAKKALGSVAQGADPAGERRQARQAATLADLARAFMVEHVAAKRKKNTADLYRHLVEKYIVPALGQRKAAAVSKVDVARLHHSLQDRPYLANRALAVVGSLYTWAGKHGLVEEGFNPALRIEKFAEDRRERFLTVEELERLGTAIREAETTGLPWEPDPKKKIKHAAKPENRRTVISPYAAAALRLLLFTGARLREILHLRWEHVDMERGLLLLPDSKTGRKAIVLNAPALMVLADLPRSGSYVIAGDNPEKPRSDLKRPWTLVSKRAGLEGVRIHDLRHTHASFGAGAGLGLPIIGKLLGHTQASTTQRYAHLDADPLRRASEAIGHRLAAALGETPRGRNGMMAKLHQRG